MIARFHFPHALPESGALILPEALAHHALRVLRLREGDAIVLFDGGGGEIDAQLRRDGRELLAVLGARRSENRESPLVLELAQALPTGDKMDWVIQKAVELGVHAIQPLQAERSVLRLSGERAERRLAHWCQVAIAACEQCGRNRLPQIRPLRTPAQWLAEASASPLWVMDPRGTQRLAAAPLPDPEQGLRLAVGPEGGWSEGELASLRAAGCVAVTLGPRVLRTETAGLAALAVLQARWGDF